MADPDLEIRGGGVAERTAFCFYCPAGFLPSIISITHNKPVGGGGQVPLVLSLDPTYLPCNLENIQNSSQYLE